MYIGIDVGGTHTDAVLLDSDFRVHSTAKALTESDFILSLEKVLTKILQDLPKRGLVKRITISTTLGLNSVLTGSADKVGVLVTLGPGLPFDPSVLGVPTRVLSATQDHRGLILTPFNLQEAKQAAEELVEQGAQALVVASKFGPKNPALESEIVGAIQGIPSGPVLGASSVFGSLNFPRRLGSAILNAAVWRLYGKFLRDLEFTIKGQGLSAKINILKSDGGIMGFEEANRVPVNALAAGPAASLLGMWSLYNDSGDEDLLMVDMGGTSTDLSILSRGAPLMTSRGMRVAGRDTLVRGLLTSSLALGGDTDLSWDGDKFIPEAKRRGLALALDPLNADSRPPTLTDALNVLGRTQVGDVDISLKAFAKLGSDPKSIAQKAVEAVFGHLTSALSEFLERANRQPVYTINEFLVDWKLEPKKVVFLGGPAFPMAEFSRDFLGIPAEAPKEATYANALGAALARPTFEAELYADTVMGTMSIPTLGINKKINPSYNLDSAKKDLLDALAGQERVQLTLEESFNQVVHYGRTGRTIRVKAQGSPGLISMNS
ncbi:MAG: hypothetical protein LBE38_00765 [Deltaproteobacteria bacterium]|jgi:N-methylhydantoinase A/oxoprolinase/acetone carboxylase beta subunit|nr:hypothetical protein [Deltaproteobacteria bacterium]